MYVPFVYFPEEPPVELPAAAGVPFGWDLRRSLLMTITSFLCITVLPRGMMALFPRLMSTISSLLSGEYWKTFLPIHSLPLSMRRSESCMRSSSSKSRALMMTLSPGSILVFPLGMMAFSSLIITAMRVSCGIGRSLMTLPHQESFSPMFICTKLTSMLSE